MTAQSESRAAIHERTAVALSLAALGGYLDAYTYVLKNGVFANAQTGNVVLLAISALSWNLATIGRYAFPILFFSAGILISELFKAQETAHPRRIELVLSLESAILLAIGFFGNKLPDSATTCSISFLAALQVSTFNRLNGSAIATTMITGNLRSSMECLYRFIRHGQGEDGRRFAGYALVIGTFAAGASVGAYASKALGDGAIFCSLLFIGIAYLAYRWGRRA